MGRKRKDGQGQDPTEGQDPGIGLEQAANYLQLLRMPIPESFEDTIVVGVRLKFQREGTPPYARVFTKYFGSPKAEREGLAELMELNSRGYDVYAVLGVYHRAPAGRKQTATKDDISGVTVFHVEIDVHPGLSEDDIKKLLQSAPLKPTIVVQSGPLGGLHVLYVLTHFCMDLKLAEQANRALAFFFKAKDRGTVDVTRCLRLPGTLNLKPEYAGQEPFRAKLLHCDAEQTYSVEEICETFQAERFEKPKNRAKGTGKEKRQKTGDHSDAMSALPEFLQPLYAQDRKLRRMWHRETPQTQVDASGADHALLCRIIELFRAVSDEQLEQALLAVREFHGDRPEKAERGDYVNSTIASARAAAGTGSTTDIPPDWLVPARILRARLGDDLGPAYIIDRILLRNTFVILGGRSKEGKSTLMVALAMSVALGKPPFIETFPVKQTGRVFIISAEDSEQIVMDRLSRLAAAHGITDPGTLDIHISCRKGFRLDDPGWFSALEGLVAELTPVLIILDPLRGVFSGDENDSASARRFAERVRALQEICGSSIVVIHHLRKERDIGGAWTRPSESLRGSTDFHAAADTVLILRRNRDVCTLEGEHRAGPPLEKFRFKVLQDEKTLRFVPAPDAIEELREAIVEVAGNEGPPSGLTKTEIADRVRKQKKRVLDMVAEMIAQGALVAADGGDPGKHGARLLLKPWVPEEPAQHVDNEEAAGCDEDEDDEEVYEI